MFLGALLDAVIDTLKLLPFLFITYLFMEYLESRTEDASTNALRKMGRLGPLFGGAVGVVPQCGFSAAAASLFSGGVITVGSMFAVFLSTSDEMLPILISERAGIGRIAHIVLVKLVIGIVSGFLLDLLNRTLRANKRSPRHAIHELCENEHCGCDDDEHHGILKPALIHTLHIAIFLFIFTLALNLLLEAGLQDALTAVLGDHSLFGVFIAAAIGLIPNCGASILLTELFLHGILGSGMMMAGLLVNAGLGLLVLYRTNRHMKENLQVTAALYGIGVFWGLIIQTAGLTF